MNRFWSILAGWALILACCIALWLRYPVDQAIHHGPVPGDFSVYVQAWQRISAGATPYVSSDPSPYKYAPGVLALMGLLPKTSPGAAWFVFGTLSILALGLSLLLGALYRSWWQVLALALGLALAWKGILETLDYGQMELIILGMAVLSTVLLRRASFLSGVLAGTLPWIKMPWGLLGLPLVVILLARKQGKLAPFFSGYFAACFAWGAAVPAVLFGSERAMHLSQQWVALLRGQPESLYFSNINQSLWVSVIRWLGPDPSLTWILGALGIACVALGLILGRMIQKTRMRSAQPQFSALAAIGPWLLFVQLLNPLSWRWGSVLAIGIPFAAINSQGAEIRRGPLRVAVWGAVIALWLLQLNPVVQAMGWHHWTELHSWGEVTLYWLGLLLLSI
jgi:hypothetical protein